MVANVTCVFRKDRLLSSVLLGMAVLSWSWVRLNPYPLLPAGTPLRLSGINSSSVRSELERRLSLVSREEGLVVAELPTNLGHLEPKGRTNPDGSEVWGYPAGSDLEDLIEVHVKDGRVVREVLRPSARISLKALNGS